MSLNISQKATKEARSLPDQFATMIIRFRLLIITVLLALTTVSQTVVAYAAPGDKGGGNALNPPSWCPLPTYKSSAGFIEGFNAATRDASGWGIVIAFAIIPLCGVAIIFFSRDTERGRKIMKKIKDTTFGVGIVIFGTIGLTIVFALAGIILSAALKGVGISCG